MLNLRRQPRRAVSAKEIQVKLSWSQQRFECPGNVERFVHEPPLSFRCQAVSIASDFLFNWKIARLTLRSLLDGENWFSLEFSPGSCKVFARRRSRHRKRKSFGFYKLCIMYNLKTRFQKFSISFFSFVWKCTEILVSVGFFPINGILSNV